MRKMNEKISTTGIKTRFCIKFLRIYLLYINKRNKCREVWRSITGNS